ncbi:MAG TPA: hypothetical protein VK604_02060 [Bryobacteraceae bacterium]|nr:hypothetical protein [Bryobacteraceae bacterium]
MRHRQGYKAIVNVWEFALLKSEGETITNDLFCDVGIVKYDRAGSVISREYRPAIGGCKNRLKVPLELIHNFSV